MSTLATATRVGPLGFLQDVSLAKVKEIQDLGINDIWLRCFSAPRTEIEHEKVIVPFAQKVMPAFA